MDDINCTKDYQNRFLHIRNLISLPRSNFKKYNFSPETIKSWEMNNETQKKVSKAKIEQYIKIYYENFNIVVPLEWLVYGEGEGPTFAEKIIINNNFDYLGVTVDLMLNNLPFFFLFDNKLILKRINPYYAHLISNDNINNIENKPISHIIDPGLFQQHIPSFIKALGGETFNMNLPCYNKYESRKSIVPIKFCPYIVKNKNVIGVFTLIEKTLGF